MTSPPPTLPGPASAATLVVRTAFDDAAGWASLVEGAATPSPEGFLANVTIVDVEGYRDLPPARLRELLPPAEYVAFFLVADAPAVSDHEHPLLVVPVPQAATPFLDEPPREPFRVVVRSLWAVENNLSLANMDWEDFAGACVDGVFRDF